MKLAWAVFGERNGGHALLGASGTKDLASRITQFTDRPGDPPLGLDWGPVVSGFYFIDHYVLLRIMPDPTAGRAGMVRSYAAFLPSDMLGSIGNLSAIFNELPSELIKPPSLLQPLNITEKVSLKTEASGEPLGLASIARQLCASDPTLPLIWNSTEPYLPTIDALWAKLPLTLRTTFAFAFQFAPENKLPTSPTLVATLPSLASRWPPTQTIKMNKEVVAQPNTAQKWLTGLIDPTGFNTVLQNYGMEVREFKELSILSSFVDLMDRKDSLSFSETRKAVRILEKYGKLSSASSKYRKQLFERLCELVLTCSPDDISTLRNFSSVDLADLMPLLVVSIEKWINSTVNLTNPDLSFLSPLELAIASVGTWWSAPFVNWLISLVSPLTIQHSRMIWHYALASSSVADFISSHLAPKENAEETIIRSMPPSLSSAQVATSLKLAKEYGWMRLHARCLMLTLPREEAIIAHIPAMNNSTDGLDVFDAEWGLLPLLKIACKIENQILDQYVGCRFSENRDSAIQIPDATCLRWPVILGYAVAADSGPLITPLRESVITELTNHPGTTAESRVLCERCCSRDLSVFLSIPNSPKLLENLGIGRKNEIVTAINKLVVMEIEAGNKILFSDTKSTRELLDTEALLECLQNVHISAAAATGVKAFESLDFLTDSECRRWLIDVFTRSHRDPIQSIDAGNIASLLLVRDFPLSAQIVRDTSESYGRLDVRPIYQAIRYKYEMARGKNLISEDKGVRLPRVLVVTALPLETNAILQHLKDTKYRADIFTDISCWPHKDPLFDIYVLTTGAGNLDAQNGTLRVLSDVKPKLAFFVGVGGGVKDSDVGDVVYGTKVYYTEGGKEENGGVKARPNTEHTSEALVQLAHRVAKTMWQPSESSTASRPVKATPAVIASGEVVLTSTALDAANYQNLKAHYNDAQVVDMEAYGFLRALRDRDIKFKMVIRGVSDKIKDKAESDAQGNQPLAAKNAAAFLFALLRACPDLLNPKKKRKKILGFL